MSLVPAALLGCPAAIGAVTHSSAGRAIAFAIAAVLSIALAELELQGKAAITFALNSRRHVGDIVWLVRESGDRVEHQPAYLMDVSAEGAKFKYVDRQGHYRYRDDDGIERDGRPFDEKHDDDGRPITLAELNERRRLRDADSPCKNRCSGINWYCWANPLAFSQTAVGESTEVEEIAADSDPGEEAPSPGARETTTAADIRTEAGNTNVVKLGGEERPT